MERELDTERLHLRPFRPDDLEEFARLSADDEVMRYIGLGGPTTVAQAEKVLDWMIGHWSRYGFGNWALEDAETGEFIGRGGLNYTGGTPDFPRCVEVAYVLDKPWWGRGLATEVARASIAWGFEHLDVAQIIGIAHVPNRASQRVLQKAGLHADGSLVIQGVPFARYVIDRT